MAAHGRALCGDHGKDGRQRQPAASTISLVFEYGNRKLSRSVGPSVQGVVLAEALEECGRLPATIGALAGNEESTPRVDMDRVIHEIGNIFM